MKAHAMGLLWVGLLGTSILTGFTAAPPAALHGRISLHADGSPVVGAQVQLLVAEHRTRTDDEGRFSFSDYRPTTADTLLIRHPDHADLSLPLGELPDTSWSLEIRIPSRPFPVTQARPGSVRVSR